jgi:hypothetical protein
MTEKTTSPQAALLSPGKGRREPAGMANYDSQNEAKENFSK